MTEAATTLCLHCALPSDGPFCCTGCKVVYGLLHQEGLERFYDLRGDRGRAVNVESHDHKWLDEISFREDLSRADLDVQGLHCSGCVWLIETLFRRAGGTSVVVNPSLGRVSIVASPSFELRRFVEEVERFGYVLGPALKKVPERSSALLWRMGVCIAIAMNTMIFAVAIYAGLESGPLYHLFQRITFGLSAVSMLVGGAVFIKSAWLALRRGVLHLDLPIALGIVLAFAGSVHSYFFAQGRAYFLDTLNVFIALMLVGRYLQERVIERNRLALLASDGYEGLLTRRVQDAHVETVRCTAIKAGDTLLVAPGDLVPVDAITSREAGFSLDWINGESRPRTFEAGARVPAGSFLVGLSAVEVTAVTHFDRSPLLDLLRTPHARPSEVAMTTPFWQRFARWYVGMVLVAAAAGLLFTRDLDVATAVLIVTCPCAFGIALPLANEMVQAGLRRAGLFVRSIGFLERAAAVKTVIFDKTGTLTSGALKLAGPLPALDEDAKAALGAMVARSNHPKSVAIRRALDGHYESAPVVELPGRGLELTRDGKTYRLGAPSWVGGQGDVSFSVDGRLLADFETVEEHRPDAAREVEALRSRGYDVWLVSGDKKERVEEAARACGIERAMGEQSAEEKAALVKGRPDLLMVGDGINDSLAVESAFCSGTPAIDRPFMAARSDFYFVTPGLHPVTLALRAARGLVGLRRKILGIALAYNALAIALAYAGVMSPLVCAVFMPVSSLTTIFATTFALRRSAGLWRS